MYCLYFMLKNYTCKYHEIGRYDDDMYVKRYVGMLRIYIYEVSIRSADNIYIYKVQKTCCIVHVFAVAKSSNSIKWLLFV